MPYTQPRFSRSSALRSEFEAGPPRMFVSIAATNRSGLSYSDGAMPPMTALTSWLCLSMVLLKAAGKTFSGAFARIGSRSDAEEKVFPDACKAVASILSRSMSATMERAMRVGMNFSFTKRLIMSGLIFFTLADVPRMGVPSGWPSKSMDSKRS